MTDNMVGICPQETFSFLVRLYSNSSDTAGLKNETSL